ncbi:cysteine proteinase RD21a-like [Hibiscus syriacus]|uniref:Cysteine proteinase RD21a-like n=1 Tax=Hibiscus syriacus TaxID=106335 RepID=A0A6A3BL13_HIBSY|nr:cysteine proteinase RD21a-like [Hibiscus syriacus]
MSPIGSPLTSPAPPPGVATQRLFFKDRRLAVVYPIIQAFKTTITEDPLNITGNWVGSDICSYTGFYCDNPPDNVSAIAVAGIDFNGFHLAALTLEGFIDNLPDLAIFHANSNKFSGTVPDFSKVRYFYELDISNNGFSGTFPTTVIGIKDSSFLDIRFNSFAGDFQPTTRTPEELCAVTNLVNLSLSDNFFTKVGPVCRKLIKSGVLDVRQNCIPGLPDQKSLQECADCRVLPEPASRLWLFSFPSLAWSSPVTPEPSEPPLVISRVTANLSSPSVIHSDPQQFRVKEGEEMLLGPSGPSGRRASSRASLLATASSAGSLSPMRGV